MALGYYSGVCKLCNIQFMGAKLQQLCLKCNPEVLKLKFKVGFEFFGELVGEKVKVLEI